MCQDLRLNLGKTSKNIIIAYLLTIFSVSNIFGACCVLSKKWPKTELAYQVNVDLIPGSHGRSFCKGKNTLPIEELYIQLHFLFHVNVNFFQLKLLMKPAGLTVQNQN